jgi:transposase-like protein
MPMIEIQLHKILNVSLCWDILRSVRWESGVSCPQCGSESIVKNGKDTVHKDNQHYHCKSCGKYFDDLTETIFSGSQHPLHHWITVLYMMNLNVSNRQISHELEISEESAQAMCSTIREGVVKKNLMYNLVVRLNLTNVML